MSKRKRGVRIQSEDMRRAGRVSPLLLVAILGVVAVAILLLYGKEGPAAAGSRFMDALARGDVDALTKASIGEGKTQEELRKDWEFTTRVSKHYLFHWNIVSANVVDDETANVRVQVMRNFSPSSYEENYGLPLRKVDGEWKVVATGISREMYPGLPRPGKD